MKKLVSAFLLGAGVASGVSGFAAVPAGYETDGLIACWDAIDNQGTGTQDKSATTWVDLVGGVTFDLAGATWKDFSLSLSGSSSGGVATGATFLNYTTDDKVRTVEIVAKFPSAPTASQLLLMGTSNSKIGIGRLSGASGEMIAVCGSNSKMLKTCPINAVTTISYGYSSGVPQYDHAYHDATAAEQTANGNNWGSSDTNVYLGKRSNGNNFKGEIFAVRVYNRLLTPEEVAANRAADVVRFGYALAATVSAGSVTVSEPAMAIGGNVYVPEGTAALPIASAVDATIQLKSAVASLSVASGTLALETSCASRFKMDGLNLGANVVLKLPEKGVRVGTTLVAETGAVVKGPGKLYGPEAVCPAELQDGATYASLTAGLNGYVDGGELIAYWDAIDNQATGTHDATKLSWKDLISGKTFTWSNGYSGTWLDRSLLFNKDAFGPSLSDAFLNAVAGDATRTVEITFKTAESADGAMILMADGGSHNVMIVRDNTGMRATKDSRKPYPAITDGAFTGISYGYVSEAPQDDAAYHDGVAVAPQEEASSVSSAYTAGSVVLGYRSGYGTCWYYKGEIYAIRVYDRLLTAEEVAANYACDEDRFTRKPAATVKSGTVTVGGRTFAAGEKVMVPVEATQLVIESSADAEIALEPGFADLEVESGSLALSAAEAGQGVQLTSLTLGEDVALKLPAAGLTVFGSITADPTATVAGPGELAGSTATSPVTLTGGATYRSLAAHAFGGETVAFYPFAEGSAGTSAAGVPLLNVIDPAVCPGRIEITGTGTAKFSDEAPGEYLFTNLAYTAEGAVFRKPRSIYLSGGGAAGSADKATLFFDGLVAEAEKLGAYKIEFWYKLDNSATSSWTPFFDVCGGWAWKTAAGSSEGRIGLMLTTMGSLDPTADPACHYLQQNWKKSDGSTGTLTQQSTTYPKGETHKDGKWHHVSFNYPFHNTQFVFESDGNFGSTSYDFDGKWGPRPDGAANTVQVNRGGNFRGWISCVRLSRNEGTVRAATKSCELRHLRPSSNPTCLPREVAHWRFEEPPAGTALPDTVANSVSYNLQNPDVYYWPKTDLSDPVISGRVFADAELFATAEGETIAAPVTTADVKKKFVYFNSDVEDRIANVGSARLATTDYQSGRSSAGPGLLLRAGSFVPFSNTSKFTVELFYKFDLAEWKAAAGDNPLRKRVALFWQTWADGLYTSDGNYCENLALVIDLENEQNPKIGFHGYTTSVVGWASPKVADGRWHHVALTVDLDTGADKYSASNQLYFDYQLVKTGTSLYYKGSSTESRHYWFARGDKGSNTSTANGFLGLLDEIRVSNGILQPEEFLRQKSFDGLLLLVK